MGEPRIYAVPPAPEHRKQVMAYRKEFLRNKEKMVIGAGSLGDYLSYRSWLRDITRNQKAETALPGWVPTSYFLLLRREDDYLVGIANVRHHLQDPEHYLERYGGHIGYGIRPSLRQQGYGTEMLALMLVESQHLGLARVLVTCDESNLGSAGVIENNGGVLESIKPDPGNESKKRYWLNTTKEESPHEIPATRISTALP